MLRKLTLPALGLLLAGSTVWGLRRNASADSAPLQAARAAEAPTVHADAHVASARGAHVTVGSERGGRVARLLVVEGRDVRKGDVLAELDDDEDQAALAEARARVAQAEADLRYAEVTLERVRRLSAENTLAADALDRAAHDRDVAAAQRDLAKATVRRLTVATGKARIVAPIDGVVLEQHVDAGEIVLPGAPIITVADLSRTRVIAELDEYDLSKVHPGDPVTIRAEGFEGAWQGRIESIPEQVARRGLRPQDPGRPTDTGVLRVEVISLERLPLKLGQRAEVEITTRSDVAEVARR